VKVGFGRIDYRLDEEGGAAAQEAEGGEEGGEETKQEHLSDISDEEEIKIPPKDLSGRFSIIFN
jgi:hypothetical protein